MLRRSTTTTAAASTLQRADGPVSLRRTAMVRAHAKYVVSVMQPSRAADDAAALEAEARLGVREAINQLRDEAEVYRMSRESNPELCKRIAVHATPPARHGPTGAVQPLAGHVLRVAVGHPVVEDEFDLLVISWSQEIGGVRVMPNRCLAKFADVRDGVAYVRRKTRPLAFRLDAATLEWRIDEPVYAAVPHTVAWRGLQSADDDICLESAPTDAALAPDAAPMQDAASNTTPTPDAPGTALS